MSAVAQFRSRHLSGGAVIAFLTALTPVTVAAQSTPTDRIDAIEQQIRTLQGELQSLKRELGDTKAKLRTSQSEAQRAKVQAQQDLMAQHIPTKD